MVKKNVEKVIKFAFICLILVLALSDNIIIKSAIVFIILLIIFITILLKFIDTKLPILKDVRKRNYFFVTEKGYKTDLRKRREIGNYIYWITNLFLILVVMIVTPIVLRYDWLSFLKYLPTVALGFAIFGIVLAARNYLTGLYYYLVPLIVLLANIDYIPHCDNNIKVIAMFILWTLLSYTVLTVLLPLHSLRKVNNTTWLFGVLTTLLISIIFKYVLQYSFVNNSQNELISKVITIESLEQFKVSIKVKQIIVDLLKRFIEISNSYEMSSINSGLSLMGFLMLTSYSIGSIIINLKIKLGESKSKDIYDKIILSEEVKYTELRDCIFYGGEKYEDKILSNPGYRSIILKEESCREKYKETSLWITAPSKVIGCLMKLMKKLI